MKRTNLVAKTYDPDSGAPADETEALLSKQLEEIAEFVVCILRAEGEKVEQIASGFIVAHRGKYVLLTAAHVIDDWFSGDSQPRFGIGGRTRGLSIKRRAWTNQDVGSPLRELDVGLWEIEIDGRHGEEIKKYAFSSDWLRSTGIIDSNKHVLIAGFPNRLNTDAVWAHYLPEPEVTGSLYSYAYLPNLAFDLSSLEKRQETHVAIDWMAVDENNCPILFPRGVSGAPAWVFPNEGGIDNAKIVGLFIEYDDDKNVGIITRSEMILQLLDHLIDEPD